MSTNPAKIHDDSGAVHPDVERFLELLSIRTVEGLTEAEDLELQSLARKYPEIDPGALDRAAAAAVFDPAREPMEPMPAAVKERIARRLGLEFARPVREPSAEGPLPFRAPARSGLRAMGWLAMAACAAIMGAAWWPRVALMGSPRQSQLLAELLVRDPDAPVVTMSAGVSSRGEGLTVQVIWSNDEGHGFLRFRGQGPAITDGGRFQAWVYDKDGAGPEVPVSAGVFAVPPGPIAGEFVLALRPVVHIGRPAGFVVSVERPEGVARPTRENVVFESTVK